jgi:plasmid stability protein
MAQVIIRNLDRAVVDILEARAARRGRSLEQELREIVTAAPRPVSEDLLSAVDRVRAVTPPGRHADSVELLRVHRQR